MIPCPPCIKPDTWLAFDQMRRSMGKSIPWSEFAAKRIATKLETFHEQGYDADYILAEAIEHGWRSVFVRGDTPRRQMPVSPVLKLMEKADEPPADPARVAEIMANWRNKRVG